MWGANLLFYRYVIGVDSFPFEIQRTGWGEFDIGMRIYFNDPAERTVEIKHFLKLHPN